MPTYDDQSKLYQLAQFRSVFGNNSSLWRQLLEWLHHCTDFNIKYIFQHNTLQWELSDDIEYEYFYDYNEKLKLFIGYIRAALMNFPLYPFL